ncbi:MAG TPA: GntR family transcriptional regulator [candidate division Zixibacteria bacterium]|nr:GntR family transcriptional regulator [candidate division Zixibacteria bacterium]
MRTARRPLLTDTVRDQLRQAIESGEYPPNSKLPNESQLGDRFGVSRATIREAVRGLVEEAYLRRVHGSGTYVLPRPPLQNSLDLNFSYTELIAASGRRPGERLLWLSRVPAGGEVGERLEIGPGEEVVRLERVRTADGRPAIYSVDYLPAAILGAGVRNERLRHSIYRLLAEVGHAVHHGEATLTPAAADARLAEILGCVPGTLLQFIDQVDFDASGNRVLYSREWHLPQAVELRVYRRGPGDVR